jgi:hypothetical protein
MDNGYKIAPPVLEFDEGHLHFKAGVDRRSWRIPVDEPRRPAFLAGARRAAEKRTNGDGRPGGGEHGITVTIKTTSG